MAYVAQTMCLMVLVPYTKEINLGRLPVGDHTLRFINGDETYFEKTMGNALVTPYVVTADELHLNLSLSGQDLVYGLKRTD